jgi:methionyl-tRNA synthetase
MRILVTAALPYANGPLHLGHIRSTYLPADIYARYQRLAGNEVLYICASDEHGTPIVATAEKEKKTPKDVVDYYHERDKREFEALGFSMDIFHRTTSDENREMTLLFFKLLNENGHIYEREVERPYCEHCKRFLPDRFVVGTCPYCKAENQYSDLCESCGRTLKEGEVIGPKCIFCSSTPITKTSRHHFLRLSSFSQKLQEWLTNNKTLQKEVVNYVLNWLKEGLLDWDITRNMDWGIKVPGKEDMRFYVWFDAPIGYISSTAALTPKWEDFWKGDSRIVHFIGKDIVYHHFLFWPAMLMGVGNGFRTPDVIAVRGYLNLEHRKFSKSKNWFVSLGDFLSAFPPDYLRYYETALTPHSVEDADFAWADFQKRINNELIAALGNFVHRTLVLIQKEGEVPQPENMDEEDNGMLSLITEARNEIGEAIERFDLRGGQEKLMALSSEFNKYLSEREPWKEKDQKRRKNTVYVCSRAISALAGLMRPFLPFTSDSLMEMVGIKNESIKWEDADRELIPQGYKLANIKPLFEKISDERISEQEKKLGG